MKYIFFLATLALFSHQSPNVDPRLENVGIENVRGTYGANTAPALKESVDSWFATFEALYWIPKMTQTGYASTHNGPRTTYPSIESAKIINFDWEWGLRVGLGYHLDFDNWNLFSEFTYFDFSDSASVTAPSGGSVLPVFFYDDIIGSGEDISFATSGKSSYDIDYKTLTGQLGRNFFVSKNLSIQPSFGLKGVWIDHCQSASYTGGDRAQGGVGTGTIYYTSKTDTKGVGPLVNLNSGWHLSEKWSLYSNAGFSLLISRLKPSIRSTTSTDETNQLISGTSLIRQIVPNPMLNLGIAYGKYISNETMFISAKFGFETQYYLNQKVLLTGNNVELADAIYSSLSLYGFNFSVGLDF